MSFGEISYRQSLNKDLIMKWVKVSRMDQVKFVGEPLKNFKWSILEYLDSNIPLVTLNTIFKSGKLILVDSIILSGPVHVIIALFLIKDFS